MKIYKTLSFAVLGLAAATAFTSADVLVNYSPSVGTGYITNPQAAATVAGDVTATTLDAVLRGTRLGDGSTVSGGMGFYSTWAFVGPASYDAGIGSTYFEFTLTAVSGQAIGFDTISFGYRTPQASGGGTFYWDVRTSADNYADSLQLVSTSTINTSLNTGNLDISSLGDIGGSVTFRIYQYQAEAGQATGGASRLSNLTINGSLVPVPEAGATAGLFGVAACALLAVRLRRRYRSA